MKGFKTVKFSFKENAIEGQNTDQSEMYNLTDKPAVYYIRYGGVDFNGVSRVFTYVGETKNLRKRILEHFSTIMTGGYDLIESKKMFYQKISSISLHWGVEIHYLETEEKYLNFYEYFVHQMVSNNSSKFEVNTNVAPTGLNFNRAAEVPTQDELLEIIDIEFGNHEFQIKELQYHLLTFSKWHYEKKNQKKPFGSPDIQVGIPGKKKYKVKGPASY